MEHVKTYRLPIKSRFSRSVIAVSLVPIVLAYSTFLLMPFSLVKFLMGGFLTTFTECLKILEDNIRNDNETTTD